MKKNTEIIQYSFRGLCLSLALRQGLDYIDGFQITVVIGIVQTDKINYFSTCLR